MATIEYRMFMDNEPATRDQLDRFDEIVVEQQEDTAWQASLVVPICLNEQGEWSGEDEEFFESFGRIRVEIRLDEDQDFVPLIDGPIVGHDSQMDSAPGQSAITLYVMDDSVYLDRSAGVFTYENKTDQQIAEELFTSVEQITECEPEETPPAEPDGPTQQVLSGTPMQILRQLAERNGMQAYVLPGEDAGESKGVFKAPAMETDGLTAFVLVGADRNLENFTVQNNAQGPARISASRLSFSDKVVSTQTTNFQDLEILGDEYAFTDEEDTAEVELSPYRSQNMDLSQAVFAETLAASYALEGSGQARNGCYPDVLTPYRAVCIQGANGRLSGPYLITRVTHRLTRSEYVQEFGVKRNAQSSGTDTSSNSSAEAMSAAISFSGSVVL